MIAIMDNDNKTIIGTIMINEKEPCDDLKFKHTLEYEDKIMCIQKALAILGNKYYCCTPEAWDAITYFYLRPDGLIRILFVEHDEFGLSQEDKAIIKNLIEHHRELKVLF